MLIARLVLAVFCSYLTACASLPSQKDAAKTHLKAGDYERAYRQVEGYFIYHDEKAKDTAELFIKDYPESLPYIVNFYDKKINEIVEPLDAVTVESGIKSANKYGLLSSEDSGKLFDRLNARASAQNQSNVIPFILTDSYEKISALNSPENSRLIFRRSVDRLSESMSQPLAMKVIEKIKEAGVGSAEYKYFLEAIPELALTKELLASDFYALYPDIAKERINLSTARVFISSPPEDADYVFGIEEQLEKNSNILLVDKDCSECFHVTVNKIRFVERDIPKNTKTVTYDRSQVNILSAALLMPNYSSYQYDLTTGGYSISYSFNVTVAKGGEKLHEKKIKGKVSETYKNCSSPTVRNAFGGVSPAGFVANADMTSACSSNSNSNSVDPEKVYAKAMKYITDGILALKPIHNRISFGME